MVLITPEQLEKFKHIYKDVFWEEISSEDALEIGTQLVVFGEASLVPKDDTLWQI